MEFQEVKKEFFSFRNGVIAKAFLDAGYPYKHIYGLQIPELGRIAAKCGISDKELAEKLWADRECRESRLLATWLFDPETTDFRKAVEIMMDVRTQEEADLLAFRFLKRLSFAHELSDSELPGGNSTPLLNYVREALKRNLK